MKIFASRPKIWMIILVGLALAVAIPWLMGRQAHTPRHRVFTVTAARYGYTPSRIVVHQGDTVVLKTTSADVTHGFSLDGYPVDLIIKQQGVTYQKYSWKDDDGKLHDDWDKVAQVRVRGGQERQVRLSLHPGLRQPASLYDRRADRHPRRALPLCLFHLHLAGGKSLAARRLRQPMVPVGPPAKGINLLSHSRLLSWLFQRRGLQFALLLPMAAIFYLFIISAFCGSPVGNHNITIIFVWIFWWFLLKAIFVPLGGRLWCTVCPLPAPAEWLSRKALTGVRAIARPLRGLRHSFTGLQQDWPKKLQNMWLQNLVFMGMISFGIMLITRPIATGMAFVLILAVTVVLALIFRRRVFCRYICPVSGFLGTYSMASMTAVRAMDPEVCRSHKEKSCLQGNERGWGCPWGQYPAP